MRTTTLLTLLLATTVASPPPLRAQSAARPPLFTRGDAVWSAAFLVGSIALSRADVRIARAWTDSAAHNPARDRVARNFARIQEGTLTVGNIALWGMGRLTKSNAMADMTFHAAESVVVGSLTAQVIRGPLGRSRPYETGYSDQYDFHPFQGFAKFRYRAFPSIHTASAFAVATVYTLETQRRSRGAAWIVAPIAYALAAGPGISRMYNGQHWASDILSGAFLGVLTGAKVVKFNHEVRPENKVNRFFLGRDNVRLGIAGDGIGFSYSARF